MRTQLEKVSGERSRYSGTISRFGKKTSYGYTKETILLVDVRDESGTLITDHLWFNYTEGFLFAGVDVGDRVSFCARSKPYTKGYSRDDMDYKLSHPTKIEVEDSPS